ncbi:SWPV1-237 [Shearwaterpox virus]|uniref:SWPV1-237 n=1 Tax=Shearwaterpox virus TaxID=1974596 RepID=A0A1V0S848_CNPV|nr:SWPV1-237 [Shearwaterpox virus]
MGRDNCGIDKCIRKFESLVIQTWDQDLNERSFLNRRDRKIVRNIFRNFIHYSCNTDLIHGVQTQVLYPKSLDNHFLGEFIRYNNQGIKKLYNKIDMSNDRMPDISTKGRYIVYFVTYLLYMGNNDIKFNYSDSSHNVSKKIADIVTDYLRLVSSVHSRFKCKCMFIGLPTYYVHLMSADDIIMAMESVADKPRNGPEEYERNSTIHIKEMCAYQDFLNFIVASKKTKNKGLCVKLCGIPFETDYSMSELIMDGLCYCFTDEVTIKKGYYEFVQLYTKCHIGDTYEYLRLTDEYPTTKMSFSPNCVHDCTAIRIFKDKDNDFYQNRHTLFFPDDCRKWKWYLDEDKHPSYDYSSDRERRPRDYKEYYVDNTECDKKKNCPTNDVNDFERDYENDYDDEEDNLIKDEAPALNRHHSLTDRRREKYRKGKYNSYEDERPRYKDRNNKKRYEDPIVPRRFNELEDAKEFEDEMMEAIADDDYTPKSIRRRNRYLSRDEDYYYDRGYRYLMAERDPDKRNPGRKEREDYPRNGLPKSDDERISDADKAMKKLESNGFKDRYRRIQEKMNHLEDDYEDLRKHAIELPKKLDVQSGNGVRDTRDTKSWF